MDAGGFASIMIMRRLLQQRKWLIRNFYGEDGLFDRIHSVREKFTSPPALSEGATPRESAKARRPVRKISDQIPQREPLKNRQRGSARALPAKCPLGLSTLRLERANAVEFSLQAAYAKLQFRSCARYGVL